MSDLAERIRAVNEMYRTPACCTYEHFLNECRVIAIDNAPTLLAGLAALEERDKLREALENSDDTLKRLRELVDDALIYDDEQEHEMRKLLNLRTD